MHPFPHSYRVEAASEPVGGVTLSAPELPALSTAPPTEFGGPGDQWSPETLLVGAAVDCFILTFRAIAEASKLPWRQLTCVGEGSVDRADGKTRLTGLALRARLTVAAGTDEGKAKRLLEKAESACLVTNSLAVQPTLSCEVEVR